MRRCTEQDHGRPSEVIFRLRTLQRQRTSSYPSGKRNQTSHMRHVVHKLAAVLIADFPNGWKVVLEEHLTPVKDKKSRLVDLHCQWQQLDVDVVALFISRCRYNISTEQTCEWSTCSVRVVPSMFARRGHDGAVTSAA